MDIRNIKRVVSGVASDEEKRSVTDWVAGNEERQRFLEDAGRFYASEMPDEREVACRTDKMWRETFGWRRKNRMFSFRWIAVASAAVVAGVFFFADLRLKKSAESDGSALQPLVAAVQLVLPDGRCYELTDEGTVQEIVAVAEKRDAFDSHEQRLSADTVIVPVVEYGEIIVPKGKGYTLRLADRSVVTLNAESRIKFPTRFTEAERRIVLNGEAYFDVAHDEAHPFVVEFAEGAVRVLGTEFNVKAYEGQHTCATLVEGRVEVLAADETVVLQPGELCEILPDGLSVCEADLMSVLSWKNGEFVFKEASWQQVAEELERWYDVEMVYDIAEMADMKLHIYMERPETLAEALEVIARIVRFDYSVQGRKVIIKKR